VDAEGNRIIGRGPLQGDFYARKPVSYAFGGTLPTFRPENHPHSEVQAARINYETAELRNRERLEKAIFFLSQTDDGRRLLELANAMQFSFVFDQRTLDAREAIGLCDFRSKLIPVHPDSSPQTLMLTVKHELQHMENMADGIFLDTKETLSSFQLVSRALEASARVSEAVAVYECIHGDPAGTPHQFSPPGISQLFECKLPAMAAALNSPSAQQAAKDKNWKVFAQIVFPAFYKEKPTLATYDRDMLGVYSKNMPVDMNDPASLEDLQASFKNDASGFKAACDVRSNPRYMREHFMAQSTWSHWKIAKFLTVNGATFLDPTGATFNLDDPALLAFQDDSKTRSAFQIFQDKIAKLQAHGHKVVSVDLPPMLEDAPPSARPSRSIFRQIAERLRHSTVFSKNTPTPSSPDILPRPLALAAIVLPHGGALEAARAQQLFIAHNETGAEATLKNFSASLRSTPYNQSPNDKVCFAIMDYADRHRRGISSDAHIFASKELIDLGLRAPIAAFPSAYIQRVLIRVAEGLHASTSGGNYAAFSDSEKRLLQHWQDIASRGANPFDADTVPGHVSPDIMVTTYGRCLTQCFKVSDSKQPLSILTIVELNSRSDLASPQVAATASRQPAQEKKARKHSFMTKTP
jgi:hypothetical protein